MRVKEDMWFTCDTSRFPRSSLHEDSLVFRAHQQGKLNPGVRGQIASRVMGWTLPKALQSIRFRHAQSGLCEGILNHQSPRIGPSPWFGDLILCSLESLVSRCLQLLLQLSQSNALTGWSLTVAASLSLVKVHQQNGPVTGTLGADFPLRTLFLNLV